MRNGEQGTRPRGKSEAQPCCISNKREYILRKKRQGQLAKVGDREVEQEEEREERMAKGEIHRDKTREYLGRTSWASRKEEIENMSIEDMERKLAKSGWKPKPRDEAPVTEEE